MPHIVMVAIAVLGAITLPWAVRRAHGPRARSFVGVYIGYGLPLGVVVGMLMTRSIGDPFPFAVVLGAPFGLPPLVAGSAVHALVRAERGRFGPGLAVSCFAPIAFVTAAIMSFGFMPLFFAYAAAALVGTIMPWALVEPRWLGR